MTATPLTTVWVRPARCASMRRAASASGGLPKTCLPAATTVSTPSTTSSAPPRAARALRRAFSCATATGRPSSRSTTSVLRTVKGTPSCSRIARRCGDRDARTSARTASLRGSGPAELGEEERRLARGRLVGVRAVDHVLADLQREIAADRAGSGLERVRGADHLTRGLDGLVALEDQRDERARGDEVDKLTEERLALVLGVVLPGRRLVQRRVRQRDDAQPLALEAGEDLAGQPARQRIRLDQDQGPVHRVLLRRGGLARWRLGRGGLLRDAAATAARRLARDLRLAVRAELPLRVQRPGADLAGVLELAQAVRAAQERLLDLVLTMRAEVDVLLVQARLDDLDLQLALADVLQVLRRPDDHVDDRPGEREEEGGTGRGGDEERILDPAAGVGEGVVDEREPDDDEYEDQELERGVQRVALDPEDGGGHHGFAEGYPARLQEESPEAVADREEHEDHERDDRRDGGHHGRQRRPVVLVAQRPPRPVRPRRAGGVRRPASAPGAHRTRSPTR